MKSLSPQSLQITSLASPRARAPPAQTCRPACCGPMYRSLRAGKLVCAQSLPRNKLSLPCSQRQQLTHVRPHPLCQPLERVQCDRVDSSQSGGSHEHIACFLQKLPDSKDALALFASLAAVADWWLLLSSEQLLGESNVLRGRLVKAFQSYIDCEGEGEPRSLQPAALCRDGQKSAERG